ncbi:carbamate kinase [Salinisphaera sp. LB1]|uniref:carbamate kinase n=1 Tax=Salinisphaera sp. LB1 TaxID=2183911 RepID=UPI000D7079C8|nr:carbamate kinase [Salinisphaera sp. LB1]AWN17170.1 Carbamate kinase [Salinisphaera sp. LB1]
MRVVAALGGNALLRRGQPLSAENQRENARVAAEALLPIVAAGHELVIAHGNGPQVGLLALQNDAYKAGEAYPLDVLGAESEGMIGYLLEQELANVLPLNRRVVTLLTQVEVDRHDAAFATPSKPIGPVYSRDEADALSVRHGWRIAADGASYRRVVPSPAPRRILELDAVGLLLRHRMIPICAGGGGIPVVRREDDRYGGVEAVIDKDATSALLARQLKADALLMLTDIDAVQTDFGTPQARRLRRVGADALDDIAFADGSMAPKIAAAQTFVRETGGFAAIGRLNDADLLLVGRAGTRIEASPGGERSYYWHKYN